MWMKLPLSFGGLQSNFIPQLIMDAITNVTCFHDLRFPWQLRIRWHGNIIVHPGCAGSLLGEKMVDMLLDETFKGVLSVIMSLISTELLIWLIYNNIHAHVLPQLFGKFGESAFNLYWLIMSIYAGLNEHEAVSHDGPFAIPIYSMLYWRYPEFYEVIISPC